MTSLSHLPWLLGFGIPGGYEWIILLVLGLLIFGRRLPEVGRSVGKAIVEFKRGVKGIEGEIEDESSRQPPALKPPEPAAATEPRQPEAEELPTATPAPPPPAETAEAGSEPQRPEQVEASPTGSDTDRVSS